MPLKTNQKCLIEFVKESLCGAHHNLQEEVIADNAVWNLTDFTDPASFSSVYSGSSILYIRTCNNGDLKY